MTRIRTIKPEFWGDEKMAPLSPIDRLVFLGLISMADDTGRVLDSIRAIDGFIFPETEDSARDSLDRLVENGRLDRGVTASGQSIIQIVNWSHQKIDKPNFAAALPPIAIAEVSPTPRRTIPAKLRDAIFARDGGACQECGVEVRRDKRDKYDSDDDLGEIDHIIPVIEGGENNPQNLRLLCLGCNRKKAGEDVRRRNVERSATNRRAVAEASTLHTNDLRSTTNDPLPGTNDPRPPTAAAREHEVLGVLGQPLIDARNELVSRLGDSRTVDDFLAASPAASRYAWARGLVAMVDPPGGRPVAPDALLLAMQDFLVADRAKWPFVGRVFRAFVDDVNRPKAARIASTGTDPVLAALDAYERAEAAKEAATR